VPHPFLDCAGPIAFAHRGGTEAAPENTLPAFEAAVGHGFRYLETDVHLTRDGVLMAFHDPRLDRVTDRAGAIAALGVAEVEAADAGHWYSPDGGRTFPFRGRGVRVPRLQTLLDRFREARINLDPKTDACVTALVDLIEAHQAWHRVCFGSFSDRRLRRIRVLSRGRACTSMGPRAVAVARIACSAGVLPRQGADCVQVPVRHGPVRLVTPRWVRAAHRAGVPVHVWTVDDERTMHALLDLGVDGLMTDRPSALREVFLSRGLPWPVAAYARRPRR
jgi:glycerophosphoryl diester phosphodiesterase